MFDGQLENGSISAVDGTLTTIADRQRSVNFIEIEAKTAYTLSINNELVLSNKIFYDKDHKFISALAPASFTTPVGAKYMKFYNANLTYAKIKLQKGTVATKWSPYNYGTIEIISKNGEQQSSNICYIKNGLVQGDYIDYSKKKVVRANGTQEDIDCSDKIVQYADSTTVYNTDGAEIEVSLTNNKAISEVNENLDRIEKKVNEINILTAELKEDVTINASSSARADNIALNELTRIGNKLSISDGGIKIGKDVNHILVSGNIRIKSNTASKRAGIQVARNLQTSDRFKFLASNIMYLSAANSTYGISSSSILIDVKENDVLYLNCYMDASATYVLSSAFCNLTVQVVD